MTVAPIARGRRRQRIPPAPPHAVTKYALDVTSGRIVAGLLVRKACERHLRDLAEGPRRGLVWDPEAADRAIGFFPLLRHYKGQWGPRAGKPEGDPIRLGPWQQFIVGSAFGWKRADGLRRFRNIYIEVAKKNGKTLMAAGIGILLAFFDEEPGAEVYAGATKRDQAKLVWLDAVEMVKKNLGLRTRIKVGATSLSRPVAASKFQPLGKDSDTDQGINVHGAIIDELHVHEDRDLIDNLETATSARTQPMIVKITTAGVKRESVWAEERADAVAVLEGRAADDATFAIIYTLDEGDDPFDEKVWPKANPNLGVSVLVDTLRQQAAKAMRQPGARAAYLRYRMNVGTARSTRGIDLEAWDQGADEPQIEDAQGCYAGLDLATVRDLTAFLAVFRDPPGSETAGTINILARFWCPEDGIDERSEHDGVPYRQWVNEGFLIATSGNVTDYDVVRDEITALAEKYAIGEIGFDKWNATQLATQLMNEGARMVAIPQTYSGLSAATKELDKLVASGKVRHGGHPILRWMASHVEFETDEHENIRPSKKLSRERIDGIVALVMALARWIANGEEPVIWTAA